MRYEIEHHLKGSPHQFYILKVWLSPNDKSPRVHTGKKRSYISTMLTRYKKA